MNLRAMLVCVGLCLSLITAVPAARAQTPPAAPPPEVEPIEPDRPDVTNGARIVDTGTFQLETGGIFARENRAQHSIGLPFTARFGLAKWIEARVEGDGVMSQVDGASRVTGFGVKRPNLSI